jgi:hypothetical protein
MWWTRAQSRTVNVTSWMFYKICSSSFITLPTMWQDMYVWLLGTCFYITKGQPLIGACNLCKWNLNLCASSMYLQLLHQTAPVLLFIFLHARDVVQCVLMKCTFLWASLSSMLRATPSCTWWYSNMWCAWITLGYIFIVRLYHFTVPIIVCVTCVLPLLSLSLSSDSRHYPV